MKELAHNRGMSSSMPTPPVGGVAAGSSLPDVARSFAIAPANINSSLTIPSVPVPAGSIAPALYARTGKRFLDVTLVLLTLPLTLPLILICAFALWLEGGLPFYRQDRLGQHGGRFSILKLRTMVRNADEKLAEYLASCPEMRREWDATQKLKQDPRITQVGRFLRSTSLDELPQLFNVLKGDMSLVGPRPMLPEQLPLYGDAQAYFALKPGITGAWQVSARNESQFSYRAQIDAAYGQELSLISDMSLMFRTVGVVLRGTGY